MTFKTINPFTGLPEAAFPSLNFAETEKRIENGFKVQKSWAKKSLEARCESIRQIGFSLKKNVEDLARLITLEMGKPIRQSRAEIIKTAWLCSHFADAAPEYLKSQSITLKDSEAKIIFQPLGVLLGIMPWNFPFWQALRFAVPAMAAGNSVLLKPAPNVPQCALALEKLMVEATGMEGLFQTLFVETEEVKKILQHPKISGVALTGSEKAGGQVASIAGLEIKKCVLELGGSDAFVVLKNSDIAAAAYSAVQSRMNNTGQTCIAAKRFIVEESVSAEFLDEVFNNFMALEMGDPREESVSLGPLARPDLVQNLSRQVDLSVQQGAKVLISGGPKDTSDNFFRPILLTNLKPGMPAFEEELFGPVATFFTVKNTEEAIRVANDTRFGLGASVWCDDLDEANLVAEQLEAGTVAINDFVRSDPRLPFGGIKKSGFGKELGLEGIREFVNLKTIVKRNA